MAPYAHDPAASPEAHVARWRATGDPQAFGALFDGTASVLFRVAVTLVPDAATAEDVLQETYTAALRKLARLPPGRPVMPWLLNALQKEAAKARRRMRRTPDPARLPTASASRDPADAFEVPDTEDVRAAIESLEEPYRSAALLRWRYGLEPSEIAHVRGEPPGTTRSLLSRALARLKRSAPILPAAFFGDARPPRGLGGVRNAVVTQATTWGDAAGLGTAAGVLAGGLLMKKAITLVVVLAALFGGWELWRPSPDPDPGDARVINRSTALTPVDLAAAPPAAADARAQREAAARPTTAPSLVEGRVLDEDGIPVHDALIVIDAKDRTSFIEGDSRHPDPTHSSGSTGRDGRFSLAMPDVSDGRAIILAEGYAAGQIDDVSPGRLKDLVLRRSGRLHGRVVDGKGRAIAGARVRWLAILGAFHTETETTSDAAGAWRLDDVKSLGSKARGDAKLVVYADGYARQILDLDAETERSLADLTEEVEIDVVLSRGARVEGHVTLADGTGAAGAHVILWTLDGDLAIEESFFDGPTHPADAHLLGRTTTDVEGRFVFEHAPSRGFHDVRREITSMVSGRKVGAWLLASRPGTTTAIGEVALVEEGGIVSVAMRIYPAFSVEGRVVDGDGKPVAGADVWASVMRDGLKLGIPKDLQSEFPTEGARSAADGTYRLNGLRVPSPPEAPLGIGAAFMFRQIGNGERDSAFLPLKGPHEGVLHAPDIVLKAHPLPFGRVRVLDEGDQPIANARLGFYEGALNFRTDAEGRADVHWYAIVSKGTGLPPQPLIVRAAGFAVTSPLLALARNTGDAPEELVIRLQRGHELSGRVSAEGGPLPRGSAVSVGNGRLTPAQAFPEAFPDRAWVEVPVDSMRTYASASLATDGSFELSGLPEGPYHLLASWTPPHDRDPSARVVPVVSIRPDVPTDARDVLVVFHVPALVATRDIDLRIVDVESGEPVLRPWGELVTTTISLEHATGRFIGRRFAPGVLRIPRVAPGRYVFHGGADGYAATTVDPVVVESSEGTPLPVVKVRRGARIAGRVTVPGGGPLHGQLMFEPYDSNVGKVIVTADANGTFEALGLPPGRYRVTNASQTVPDFAWFASDPVSLVDVAADVTELRLDGAWVLAGVANVFAKGGRFAGASKDGFLTPAQVEALKGVVFEIAEASGRVVHHRAGFTTSDARVEWSGALPPGTYVARLSVPGESTVEKRIDVVGGKTISVVLDAR